MLGSSSSLDAHAGHRGIFLALLPAFLIPASAQLFTTGAFLQAAPEPTDCPECSFGNWTCPSKCNFGQAAQYFDFTQTQVDNCTQKFPVNASAMAVEVDFRCSTNVQSVSCEKMSTYKFIGLSILGGCAPTTPAAAGLMQEKCYFFCRQGRPIQRCEWAFDTKGVYGFGTLQACWLAPKNCSGSTTELNLACKPDDLWKNASTTAGQLAQVRSNLSEALAGLLAAQANISNLSAVTAMQMAAQKQRSDTFGLVLGQLAATLGKLQAGAPAGQAEADIALSTQASSQQLGELIRELSAAAEQLPPGAMRNETLTELAVAQVMQSAVLQTLSTLMQHLAAQQAQQQELARSQQDLVGTQHNLQHSEKESLDFKTALIAGLSSLACVSAMIIAGLLYCLRAQTRKARAAGAAGEGGSVVMGRPVRGEQPGSQGGFGEVMPGSVNGEEHLIFDMQADEKKTVAGTTVTAPPRGR